MPNKYIFIGIFLSFQSLLSAQQKSFINFDKNWERSSSKLTVHYQCECFMYDNGALEGPFNCYINNTDTLVKSYNFKNGALNGKILEYYDSGNLKLEAYYNQGKPVDTWKEWSPNGDLVVDKTLTDDGVLKSDGQRKELTEYEKLYFGSKRYEEPVYTSECILMKTDTLRRMCSDEAMLAYYNVPPLPPSYFTDPKFAGKSFHVKLKYLLSEKGKVEEVKIIESSGDEFLDDLAETHILNMTPFEAAKEYENPIKYWIEAILNFNF